MCWKGCRNKNGDCQSTANFPGPWLLSRPQLLLVAGFADLVLEPSGGTAPAQAKGPPRIHY